MPRLISQYLSFNNWLALASNDKLIDNAPAREAAGGQSSSKKGTRGHVETRCNVVKWSHIASAEVMASHAAVLIRKLHLKRKESAFEYGGNVTVRGLQLDTRGQQRHLAHINRVGKFMPLHFHPVICHHHFLKK